MSLKASTSSTQIYFRENKTICYPVLFYFYLYEYFYFYFFDVIRPNIFLWKGGQWLSCIFVSYLYFYLYFYTFEKAWRHLGKYISVKGRPFIILYICICISICISIHLKRHDVIRANIFPWKGGHLLPPWRLSSLRTCRAQYSFAFPYQTSQTYLQKMTRPYPRTSMKLGSLIICQIWDIMWWAHHDCFAFCWNAGWLKKKKTFLVALAALYLTLVSQSVSESLSATFECWHIEWLLTLENNQTFDQSDV